MTDLQRLRAWLVERHAVGHFEDRTILEAVITNVDRMLAAKAPRGRTVRVRVAVVVSSCGAWEAGGSSHELDDLTYGRVQQALHDEHAADHTRLTWVTADVPLPPEPAEIEGTVEQ